MSVRHGREFLSIPGPTTVPDEVLQAMQRPAVDIYSGSMVALTDSLLADLQKVFATRGRTYIYAANGHGGWEAAFTNVLSRGDKVLVLESGRFATGWGEMAQMMGVAVEVLPQDQRKAVDPAAVEKRLKADKGHAIKAIMVVQIDTASGVVNDIAAVRAAIDRADHPALLMVDTVASLATMPF
jgi:alanine-glyoxylate transaminase/serine-glyoxylate transaminase/serine-pyruvate transaminase